jgi:next to BRCA1 gene 1 protein
MRRMTHVWLVILLVLFVAGCTQPTATPATPRPGTALPNPTVAQPTPAPTTTPQSAAPITGPKTTPTICRLNSTLVQDISVPDKTVLAPGTAFTKQWLLQNNSACAWPAQSQLVFTAGDRMSAPISVTVGALAPSGQVTVSVKMEAPLPPGTYQGYWRLRSGTESFGATIWVRIVVKTGPAPTLAAPQSPTKPTASPSGLG